MTTSHGAALDVALPARLATATSLALAGRVAELEALGAGFEAAAAGEDRVVLVAGEAGIGKTALVSEFARRVRSQDGIVLYGRCDEELAVPYQCLVEAIGHLLAHVPDRLLREHGVDHGGDLGRLVPSVSD